MLLEGAGALSHRIDQSTSNILIELEATARGIHLSIHHPEAEDLSSMMEIWNHYKNDMCTKYVLLSVWDKKNWQSVLYNYPIVKQSIDAAHGETTRAMLPN